MFDLDASQRRAQRRILKGRFRAAHAVNGLRWEATRQGLADVAPERLFYGLIRDLAKETSFAKQRTCRGAGVDFEACWPIDPRCPGVRECAHARR